MASTGIKEIKYKGYLIRIRELVEEIKRTSIVGTLSFPREHISIQKPDGDFLTAKEIINLLKKGIDGRESKRG